MEQNSSTVCVATIHNDDRKSARLSSDDAMPLYATIIPSNTRKARLQQEQAAKQTQKSPQPVCGSKSSPNASESRVSSAVDNGKEGDNDYESSSGESDDETVELWSHEIPVWIKGEQRWISGVTDQTTCLDLIEALLIDEGVIKAANDSNNNSTGANIYPTKVNDYVIAERWRRVEQVLDPRTKIFKIWAAWGAEQSEVKFTLKRRSDSHHSSSNHQSQTSQAQTSGDRDSGRGSPTGSVNSAIVRRRRHRASKSTFAWMTHGQTIHPKSQKSSIERLMKLILEQGEVIQQQLSKLRDREMEISTIEEERHKVREKEHGKNYLLETYLKGLGGDAEDKQELGAGNSDSGVHTEETAASPVVQHEDEISDALLPLNDSNMSAFKVGSKKRRSKRENELMLEHQSTKEYSSAIQDERKSDEAGTSGNKEAIDSEVAAQIDILEKLIVLNKHLQREEELCVRLSAKIKRYEADASGLSEAQVKESLSRVNEQLDTKTDEITRMESEIKTSDEALTAKTDFLAQLYDELEEAEVEQRKSEVTAQQDELSSATPNVPTLSAPKGEKLLDVNHELGMSREYLAENIYNISKMILKSSGPLIAMPPLTSANQTSADFIRHTPDMLQSMPMLNQQSYQLANGSTEKRIIQAQIYTIPTSGQQPNLKHEQAQSIASDLPLAPLNQPWNQCSKYNDAMRVSMNYLATINQRIQKSNHLETDINNANNPIMQATQYKLGPKKLLINTQVTNSNLPSVNESNIYKRNLMLQKNESNYGGVDLAGDASQMGTLV